MSDNGPYTQPPQYPGGEGNQGQPGAYGGAHGQGGQPQGQPGQPDPGTGGQPGYPSGPYQAPYGEQGTGGQQPYQGQPQAPYGQGPYPGQGGPQFQQPQDQQQMFHQGGQPPYGGGPGMPGYPPPQQPRKSSAGLWVVIAGGVVIVLLVVAVVVVLFTGSDGGTPPVAQPPGTEESAQQAPSAEPAEEPEGETSAQGEPPYSVPEDPCAGLPEGTLSQFGAEDPSKTITDSTSSCSWSTVTSDDEYGTLSVEYKTPYVGSDSVEGAQDDFEFYHDYATDEDESVFDLKVIEEQELDYGDESVFVFAEEEIISLGNRTTVLIRQDNMVVKVEWSVSSSFSSSSDEAPQTLAEVEDVMKQAGVDALGVL